MTREECIALLDRYANYDGMGIPNLAGCKEAMKKAVELLSAKPSESLEEEIWEYMSNDDNNPFDWDWRDKRDCARHFAEWGAKHLKK